MKVVNLLFLLYLFIYNTHIMIEKLKELVSKGYSNSQISKELNISISTVDRKKRENNLLKFTRGSNKERIMTEEEGNEIIKLFHENKNCSEISKKVKKDRRTISKFINNQGLSFIKDNSNIKIKCEGCEKPTSSRRKLCETCRTTIRRYKIKKEMIEYKGGCCVKCGDKDLHINCYDFHHLDPNEKDFNLSALNSARFNKEKVKSELDKCILVCSNCHRQIHAKVNEKLLLFIDKSKSFL